MDKAKLLDYAMTGVRDDIAKIGFRVTDRDLAVGEIGNELTQLSSLYRDLFELNNERAKISKGETSDG